MIKRQSKINSAYEDLIEGDYVTLKNNKWEILFKKRTSGLRVDEKGRSISTCPYCNSNITLHRKSLGLGFGGLCYDAIKIKADKNKQLLIKKDICLECGREFAIEFWFTEKVR